MDKGVHQNSHAASAPWQGNKEEDDEKTLGSVDKFRQRLEVSSLPLFMSIV